MTRPGFASLAKPGGATMNLPESLARELSEYLKTIPPTDELADDDFDFDFDDEYEEECEGEWELPSLARANDPIPDDFKLFDPSAVAAEKIED
jgi:hypothetical protein